jgi:hypothetical protein
MKHYLEEQKEYLQSIFDGRISIVEGQNFGRAEELQKTEETVFSQDAAIT